MLALLLLPLTSLSPKKELETFSSSQWWTIGPQLPETSAGGGAGGSAKKVKGGVGVNGVGPLLGGSIDELHKACEEAYEKRLVKYDLAVAADSELSWLAKVSTQGTSSDQVASLTMRVQLIAGACVLLINAWRPTRAVFGEQSLSHKE